jgi:hypothetical protein
VQSALSTATQRLNATRGGVNRQVSVFARGVAAWSLGGVAAGTASGIAARGLGRVAAGIAARSLRGVAAGITAGIAAQFLEGSIFCAWLLVLLLIILYSTNLCRT